MIRRPPRSTRKESSAASDVYKRQRVDFSQNKNLIVAAITLILGTGDFTLKFGDFALGGIGTATFGAIILYALLDHARDDQPMIH